MQKRILTILMTFLGVLVFAQPSDSKIISYAKGKYPGYQVSRPDAKELWEGLTKYYWCTFELRHKKDLPGYPGVTEVGTASVYYWANGSKKQEGYYQKLYYEGMPKPSNAEVQKALDDLDVAYYFGREDGVIEVHSMKPNDGFSYKWFSEKSLLIESGTIVYTQIGSGKSTEKIQQRMNILLDREDYKSPWTATLTLKSGLIEDRTVLETKEYSGDDWIAIENSTYYQKFAMENAKREWDALPNLDIPFTNPIELSYYAHNLFLTGTRDEVKSFLFKTSPSGAFYEGTDFRLKLSQRQDIEYILKQVFDGDKNYQNEYCATSVVGERSKYGLSFYNHNLTARSTFKFKQDMNRYSLVECKVGFSQEGFGSSNDTDARKYPCRGDLPTEKFEMPDAFCSVSFPPGMAEKETPPARLKKLNYFTTYDAAYYSVYATFMDPGNRSNADRVSIAENTAKSAIENTDGVIESSGDFFELNGVKGYELFIVYDDRGKVYEELTRFILLGEVFYEVSVRAPLLRDNEKDALKSFTSSLKGAGDGGTSSTSSSDEKTTEKEEEVKTPTSYKVGDAVLIQVAKGEWVPGIVKEDKGGGKYLVKESANDNHYIQPLANLKPNPNATSNSSSASNNSNSSTGYNKKDQVLVNTQSGWKPAVVTNVDSGGKYEVYCPDLDTYFTASDKSLKPNPGGKAKEKKNIPNIKL